MRKGYSAALKVIKADCNISNRKQKKSEHRGEAGDERICRELMRANEIPSSSKLRKINKYENAKENYKR